MSTNYETATEAFTHLVQGLEDASGATDLDAYKEAIGETLEALDDLAAHLTDVFNDATSVDNEGVPVIKGTTLDPETGRFIIEAEL